MFFRPMACIAGLGFFLQFSPNAAAELLPPRDLTVDAMLTAGEPTPTRWVHPQNLPKPSHQLPDGVGPLRSTIVSPMQPSASGTEEPKPPILQRGRICIVVRDTLMAAINTNLLQYRSDLARDGFSSLVISYSGGSAESLRAALLGYYQEAAGLKGVVLVGDIPSIIYEMMQDWDGAGGAAPEYEDFPCDLYYMDLDGTWSDTLTDGSVQPGNGKYDTRSGNTALEVWACRLRAYVPSLGSEADMLNSYLQRNHQFRFGMLSCGTSQLVYDDDDWVAQAPGDKSSVENVYGIGSTTVVSDVEATNYSDFKSTRMPTNYQLCQIRSHGYPGGHGFYRNSKTIFNYVYTSDYRSIDPPAKFYGLYVCSGCDYTASDYLGATTVFNPAAGGILAWGSTKTGGMWADNYFYTPLANGYCHGEAFRQFMNTVCAYYPDYAPRWWYGMVLIGDGTVFPYVDKDGDTLPNWWEATYGLSINDTTGNNGASGDPDADGLSNSLEFSAGSDPQLAGPAVVIASALAPATNVSPIPCSVTFASPVVGFDLGDIAVTNAVATGLAGNGAAYAFTLTPSGEGVAGASIASGIARDALNNGNTASPVFQVTYDVTRPASSASVTDATRAASLLAIHFATTDVPGSGVASTRLYVAGPGATVFSDTGLAPITGGSGSFMFTPPTDGYYRFATVALDAAGNWELEPTSADAGVLVNTVPNSTFTSVAETGSDAMVFPMTDDCDVSITLTGANPGGSVTVSRATPRAAVPVVLKYPGKLANESLFITDTGLGAFTATMEWNIDPANACADVINSAFCCENESVQVLGAACNGNVVTIGGIGSFSTWFVGNGAAVPVGLSGFVLE